MSAMTDVVPPRERCSVVRPRCSEIPYFIRKVHCTNKAVQILFAVKRQTLLYQGPQGDLNTSLPGVRARILVLYGPWALGRSLLAQLVPAPGQCRRALGRRQRLHHGGVAARIAIDVDARAQRQRAAPEGGGERCHSGVGDLVELEVQRLQVGHRPLLEERGHPGVGDLVPLKVQILQLEQRATSLEGGSERGHPGVGDLVVVEKQPFQVGHRSLLEERGQGGHRAVAHLVALEVELLHLPQAAAGVRGAERLAQREHLRVVPPQASVGECADRRHLRGEGLAVDGRHEPYVAGIRELCGLHGRDARLERRGKRRGRHRRLARGLAVVLHVEQALLLARQPL
eukprot:scaffold70379_cov65-Phaeocystis_antarctica.AAC.1